MNREQMIERLVGSYWDAFDPAESLDLILRHGFVGYNNRTDEELMEAMKDWGLIDEEEEESTPKGTHKKPVVHHTTTGDSKCTPPQSRSTSTATLMP